LWISIAQKLENTMSFESSTIQGEVHISLLFASEVVELPMSTKMLEQSLLSRRKMEDLELPKRGERFGMKLEEDGAIFSLRKD
jgi:hypothetical protein